MRKLALGAMCGRLQAVKGFSQVAALVGAAMCSAFICGSIWPLAIMPSADQVPVNSTHSTMLWPEWGVLITGSTGSALPAVGPFQPIIHAIAGAIPCAIARWAPCNTHPWPLSPKPSLPACWRVRSPRLLLAAGPAARSARAGASCHASLHIG